MSHQRVRSLVHNVHTPSHLQTGPLSVFSLCSFLIPIISRVKYKKLLNFFSLFLSRPWPFSSLQNSPLWREALPFLIRSSALVISVQFYPQNRFLIAAVRTVAAFHLILQKGCFVAPVLEYDRRLPFLAKGKLVRLIRKFLGTGYSSCPPVTERPSRVKYEGETSVLDPPGPPR